MLQQANVVVDYAALFKIEDQILGIETLLEIIKLYGEPKKKENFCCQIKC